MFGKLIIWGTDREEAINRMQSALAEIEIEGITHNVRFHQRILQDSRFRAGKYGVDFVDRFLEETKR